MNEDDKNQLLEAYTNLLVKSWTDEEFSALIDSDPALALSQSGLSVPDGASVVVWRHIASDAPDPSIDGAVDLWELGNTTGTYMMSIPPASEMASETMRPTGARCVWPGTNSVNEFATAMMGLRPRSAPSTPAARKRALAPAMLRPCVTVCER